MRRFARRRSEPTIALINVVFLLLTFFLVAGAIGARPPAGLRLARLADGAPAPMRGTVALDAAGTALWPEGVADAAGFIATLPADTAGTARILPDRAAPAAALVALARTLQAAGAQEVRILAEREGEE
ncbi:ExbD/TolR family protein [Sinirhodobacter huangdaonensis]|uniref:Biopolymer transporter ExbD n=1 Tax=Paenirhodobacter huangdaonensis TaxID=2501515 RepID=A0A3S3L902_9RHOB|nr:biopolymer transporter ExbD [Sinirhodobacter huangdaonensis]RWR48001.1 biopolymer transporter ExbD [Sinirhodobacter huangdaonensis]